MMKPPEEVFPQRKAAEFDESGRPHHSLFYTSKPNFFQMLHDIVTQIVDCNRFEDRMIRTQKQPDTALQIDMTGSQWLSHDQLKLKLVENFTALEYNNFVNAMNRLVSHPYSYRCIDFIDQYRRPLLSQTTTIDIPKPQMDQDGRSFITVYGELHLIALSSSRLSLNHHKSQLIFPECLRKRARGDVTIKSPGTGKISVNGQPITYFKYDQSREQVSFIQLFTREIMYKKKMQQNEWILISMCFIVTSEMTEAMEMDHNGSTVIASFSLIFFGGISRRSERSHSPNPFHTVYQNIDIDAEFTAYLP